MSKQSMMEEARQALASSPGVKLRLDKALGGYRIWRGGEVIATGTDVGFAYDLVEAHNRQVEKNLVTGTAHL